jgi:signal transduction histidine kinase
MAVCQFDMKGRVMYQNPAAYLPPLDEDFELDADDEENDDDDDDVESLMDGMDTDDESEFYDHLFEQPYGGVQTLSSNNSRGNFMDRFVNKKVARELLQSLQDELKEQQQQQQQLLLSSNGSSTATQNINATMVHNPNNTTTVSIEAELHTSTKGRTQWSAIQLRRTKDPVTSKPVILYSAQDKSDAMEAKREREARLQKSEFLAIMAHEIRTPLHQVTGFIDLLELDACSNTSANNNSNKNLGIVDKNSSHNALFSTSTEELDRSTTFRKCRSTSLINSTTARSWSSVLSRQTVGNLSDEQRGYIKLLKSSANQLMTVISDVLDYSKLEAGKMKIERIPFELLSVVQGSMEAVRGSCEEKGLTLTLEYGASDEDDDDDNVVPGIDIDSDRRKKFRRRRSYDGRGGYRPPRSREVGRTHS